MPQMDTPLIVVVGRIFSTPKQDMFDAIRLSLVDVAPQSDGNSRGMFCLTFDSIIRVLPIRDRITQKKIADLKIDKALHK